jgi:hypothetical protein
MTGEVAYGEVAYGHPPRGRREDPVEFIETFVRNYPKGQWIIRERERLTNAIARAAGENTGGEEKAV